MVGGRDGIGLEPVAQDRRLASLCRAAVGRLPLVTQLLADFTRQRLVRVQDDAGLSVVAVEARRVLLKASRKRNRVAAKLNRDFPVDAVKRQPADVHDLVIAVRLLPSGARVGVEVGQCLIALLHNLHAGRMQSVNLVHAPAVARHLQLVRVAVEAQVETHLLHPLITGLPAVRPLCQHVIERQILGPLAVVVVQPAVQVQRQARNRLGHHAGAREVGGRLHRRLGRDAHPGIGGHGHEVIPAAHAGFQPLDLGHGTLGLRNHGHLTRRKSRASRLASSTRPCGRRQP